MITLQNTGISEKLDIEIVDGVILNEIFIQTPFQNELRYIQYQITIDPQVAKVEKKDLLRKQKKFLKIEEIDSKLVASIKISIKNSLTTNITYLEILSDFIFKRLL